MAEEKEEEKPCYLFPLKKTSTEDYSTISAKAVTGSILLRIKRLDLLCSISDVFELYQDEKSSIRTSSSSAMISRAAQGLRTPAPRSSSLPSQIQFWSCLGSTRHGPYLHLYTLSAAPSFVQAQKRERERRKQRNVMDYDQISVSLCSAHDHADVKLSNKVLLLQGSSRLTPSMAALSLRPNP